MVNTCDIVPRIPPSLPYRPGEDYQHPGHLVFIRIHFALLQGNRPVVHLIETPQMFFWTTAFNAVVKLALALALLAAHWLRNGLAGAWRVAAAAAAAVTAVLVAASVVSLPVMAAASVVVLPVVGFGLLLVVAGLLVVVAGATCVAWYMLQRQAAPPGQQQLQQQRPALFSNPLYVIVRLLALLGPVPLVFVADVVLYSFLFVITWPTLLSESLLLLALLFFMPPVLLSGLMDHSMAEYLTATLLSSETDWE